MRYRVHYLTILLFFLAIFGVAQTRISPQYITIDDGLSQGYIAALCQDEDGFLWIGTKNGLNRYDGRKFEIFTHDPNDPYSLSNDWIKSISTEGEFLIIATNSKSLDIYHKKSKQFFHIPIMQEGVEPFYFYQNLYKASKNQFWLNTFYGNQLLRVSFPDQFWEAFPKDQSLLNKVKVELIKKDASHSGHSMVDPIFLYIKEGELNGSTLEIRKFPPESPKHKLFPFTPLTEHFALGDEVKETLDLSPFVRTSAGWQKMPTEFFIAPTSNYLFNEKIWLQDANKNDLYIFDSTSITANTSLKKSNALYISNDIGTRLGATLQGRSNIFWVGTLGLGLRKFAARNLKIQTYLNGKSIYNHIFSSASDEFLIFSESGVQYQNGKSTNNLQPIYDKFREEEHWRLYYLNTSAGEEWVAFAQTVEQEEEKLTISLYRLEEGKLTQKGPVFETDKWTNSKLILYEGINGELFLFHGDDCVRYDTQTGRSQFFKIENIDRPDIFYPAQTANGHLWLGTGIGLVQGIPNSEGFDFRLIGVQDKGLQNPVCASLLVDSSDPNILWIGTKGGGLHQLDTRTMKFEYLNSKNGLPNDVIYGILNDNAGNLWMSSNKGIINFNPSTKKIRNFTVEDGLQSNEFNTFAYGKASDGTLFFGGINGLNAFHPKDLADNPFTPNVKITNLEVNNQKIEVEDSTQILAQAIEYTSSLTLPFVQNSITLTFAALEFTAPKKNTFRYYLEGAEKPWIHTTTDDKANYLNLAPGTYTFHIKAANGDGVWSDAITTLQIKILAPWYRTTLAYLIYGVIIFGIIWWFLRFQRSKINLEYKATMEQQRAERLQELDAFRAKFYTNITHEFRTPLTVILGMATQQKQVLNQPKLIEQKANLIERNGKRLLSLINQILDLSKIENNQLNINYQQGDILKYIRYITNSFSTLANSQNILVEVDSAETEILMDYDAEKIRQILSNLLSNAIKFTPSGGRILVETSTLEEHLQINVSDTGQGIPAEDLPKIFDRFYQVSDPDNSQKSISGGSGVGLALTQELIKLLDGTITVESQLGQGTQFSLKLPIFNNAPLETQHPIIDQPKVEVKEVIETPGLIADTNLPRVLLIEDSVDVVTFLKSCLEPYYQLSYAYNGAAGIEKALEMIPDIIISDVMMPEKNGFEVTEILKNDERTSHIPIILLTARADFDSKIAGLKRGADSYIAKPFNQEELLVNLRNLLDTRKKLQAKYQEWSTPDPSSEKLNPTDLEQRFLEKLNQIIVDKMEESSLRAEDIAKEIGMSRANLYLKLSALTGLSFNIYLRKRRLHEAKQLLETTDLNISEIAYQVGFSSRNYFTTKFTEQFGVSPSKFRQL